MNWNTNEFIWLDWVILAVNLGISLARLSLLPTLVLNIWLVLQELEPKMV